jgi:hypothetical protein
MALKTLGKQSRFPEYVENLSELEEAIQWIEIAETFISKKDFQAVNSLEASKTMIEKVIKKLNNRVN